MKAPLVSVTLFDFRLIQYALFSAKLSSKSSGIRNLSQRRVLGSRVMGSFQRELEVAVAAVRDAAATIAAYYAEASVAIYTKRDASPVTDADLASDRILREHLTNSFPRDAILTEEGVDDPV